MKVEYFGNLREVAKKEVILKLENSSLFEILELQCKKFKKLRNNLFNGNELKEEVKILINGRDIRALNGLDTIVNKEDTISIFSAVGGG